MTSRATSGSLTLNGWPSLKRRYVDTQLLEEKFYRQVCGLRSIHVFFDVHAIALLSAVFD